MLKNIKKILLFSLFSLVLLAAVCRKNDDNKPGSMAFRVDKALLGETVNLDSLGITLRAPKGWNQLPDEMLRSMHEKLQGAQTDDRMFQFTPIRFFINPEQGCVLSVSQLHFTLDSTEADFNTMYRASLDQKFAQGSIHQTLFFKDDIEMNQMFIQIPKRIIIKLLFKDANGEMLQLDYMVPKDKYPELAESIESSIGTIQRKKN